MMGFCLCLSNGGSFFYDLVMGLKILNWMKWFFSVLILYIIRLEVVLYSDSFFIFCMVVK